MTRSWNKGFTKDTHASLRKTSETMRNRKIDNFAKWREQAKQNGQLKAEYKDFARNGDLAELIGVVLGDGHIEKCARTERLLIFSNANNPGFVERYTKLVRDIFEKEPYVYLQTGENCFRISVYQKDISRRLGIPAGARRDVVLPIPVWISAKRAYTIRYLRGLYEAEGYHSVHEPTYTHKFGFSNKNQSLLKNVAKSLKILGFSPCVTSRQVQISKREDVAKAMKLLEFRKYQ